MKFVFISLPMSGKTDKEIGHRLCSINGAMKNGMSYHCYSDKIKLSELEDE